MKNNLKNIEKAAQRKLAIEAGFYDGRYSNKVIPNKKKQNKDIDFLEIKRQKKPKVDTKFDPSRKNKKYFIQNTNEYI